MQKRCQSSERGKPGATPLSQGACRAHVSGVKDRDPGVEAAAFRGERRVEGGAGVESRTEVEKGSPRGKLRHVEMSSVSRVTSPSASCCVETLISFPNGY